MQTNENPAVHRLKQALGLEILAYLQDPDLNEIMLNPDGRLFAENSAGDMRCCGKLDENKARMVILTLASLSQGIFDPKIPIISCELPFSNARFEGLLPPLTRKPIFSIRRHAFGQRTLGDLLKNGMLTEVQYRILIEILRQKRSVIVCGETGCGKTTLLQAMLTQLQELSPQERVITIEDTPELKCALDNTVALYSGPSCPQERLLRSSLRLRPDRIIMGEIRGAEALDLIDALSTGHSGSMATLHAGSPKQALRRLTLLVSRHPQAPKLIEPTVVQALDLIVMLSARPAKHLVSITKVEGFAKGDFLCRYVKTAADLDAPATSFS